MAELTCPKCQGSMRAYERNGVTVDQCTECRGIFLDRGELERLIDAEGSYYEKNPGGRDRDRDRDDDDDDDDYRSRERKSSGSLGQMLGELQGGKRGHHDSHHGHHKKRKKKNFLEELFD